VRPGGAALADALAKMLGAVRPSCE
jgi:hypothetical protein